MQFCPGLAEHGIDVEVAPLLLDDYLRRRYIDKNLKLGTLLVSYFRRLKKLTQAGYYDLIWLEKEAFPGLPAAFELMVFRKPVVLDLDDAWHLKYSQSSNPVARLVLGRKLESAARHARMVITANSFLSCWAEKAGARAIHVVPTVVDLQRYPATPLPPATPFTIGWIGSPTTSVYLEKIRGALHRTLSGTDSRLLVIGANNFSLPGVCVETHPWSEDQESALLQRIHVGVMPLTRGPWEEGKSAYKMIQYMATGRPVIASPVGTCCDVLEEGVTGFFATDEDSWAATIIRLRDNLHLAAEFGCAGRKRVAESYSLQSQLPRLAALLKSAAD